MSEQTFACCEHCADALSDHVEHGGEVEKDGHDLPCPLCEHNRYVLPLQASAWELGWIAGWDASQNGDAKGSNPYQPAASDESGDDS